MLTCIQVFPTHRQNRGFGDTCVMTRRDRSITKEAIITS